MRHILIPTDFSLNAWNAIQYAFEFFREERVTFHFLHVDTAYTLPRDENLHTAGFLASGEIESELQDEMDSLVARVNAKNRINNHAIIATVVRGRFIESIRSYVKTNKIDLIAMGTKGASGIKEITVGSSTGAVITKVKCAILVIPEEATFKPPVNIGFPTDFNIPYTNKVLQLLQGMAKVHQSVVKVLRVAQNEQPLNAFQNTNRIYLNDSLAEVPHSFHVVEDPNLEDALQSFVSSFKIDMVVMIAKSLNLFQRILFKPRVQKISYHTQIPFLVLHE
ncbi:MAG: universal stress protein [Flavobacteriaceae bacterium]|nr:universal stress protein [Flavobacteriaceae bacterium]|tara:strand:+ start:4840 stop:5676 length:837 start_codon:yes stop_codon:yes gene_type:complete